jgi:integrase
LKVYQAADGRWIAPLRIPGQKRPHRIYSNVSEDDAFAKRDQFRLEIARGFRHESGQVGALGGKKLVYLNDWLDHWLEHIMKPVYDARTGERVKGRQPTTYQNYRWHVERCMKPTIGTIKLLELKTSDVEAWHADMLKQGVAVTVAFEAKRTLVIALNYALKRREETHLTYNAAALFKLRQPTRRPKAAPDPEALLKILETAQGDRMELVIYLGLQLGLRRQEIAALQWRDWDFSSNELLIRRRVNRIAKDILGTAVIERMGPKMGDEQVVQRIPFDPVEWKPLLQRHRQWTLEFYAKHRNGWTGLDPRDEAAFLFTNQRGGLFDPKFMYRLVKDLFIKAGYPDKTLHGLRHDFAGMLADSGATLLEISRALRHASTAVTDQVYTHLTDERNRTTVGKAAQWLAAARTAPATGTTG